MPPVKKVFYLSTCSTCTRIINDLDLGKDFVLQDIKKEPVTARQLDEMKALAGSYENLFSKRARKYSSMRLNQQDLSEADYRKLILEEYTFLKRPVVVTNNRIYTGSAPKTLEALRKSLK